MIPVRSVLATACLLAAASAPGAETHALAPAESDGRALVASVVAGSSADILVLDGGYARGLRPGAVCTLSRAGAPLGSVIVAESARARSVALVLELAPGVSVSAGDLVSVRANPRL